MIGNLNKKVTHINRDIILVTDTYTVDITDDIILCNGTFTLTLPVLPQDREVMFKVINIGTGTITISRSILRTVRVANSNLIDGTITIILKDQYNSIVLLSHLSNYYSVGKVDTWDKILSTTNTFNVGDSDGDGNSTSITIDDSLLKITINATDIGLNSSGVTQSEFLFADGFKNIISKSIAEIYNLDPTPNANLSWNGLTIIATAGEDLVYAAPVYLKSDGKFWNIDADAESTTKGMAALATGTILADASGTFLLKGFLRYDIWNWTIGTELYAHTTVANLTSTKPSGSSDVVRKLAYAYSADIAYFDPSNEYSVIP